MTSEINRCYRVLELEPGALLGQVKQAWRELVKVWHPDRFPNDAKMQRKAQERLKAINRAYEVLSQFLASENGEQTASAAARGRDDGSSPEAKAGRTVPPVPPSGHSESNRSATPKKAKAKVICLLVLAFGVVAYSVHVATRYHAFTNQLSVVRGIHIGDSGEEMKYRLGFPPELDVAKIGSYMTKLNSSSEDLLFLIGDTRSEVDRDILLNIDDAAADAESAIGDIKKLLVIKSLMRMNLINKLSLDLSAPTLREQ